MDLAQNLIISSPITIKKFPQTNSQINKKKSSLKQGYQLQKNDINNLIQQEQDFERQDSVPFDIQKELLPQIQQSNTKRYSQLIQKNSYQNSNYQVPQVKGINQLMEKLKTKESMGKMINFCQSLNQREQMLLENKNSKRKGISYINCSNPNAVNQYNVFQSSNIFVIGNGQQQINSNKINISNNNLVGSHSTINNTNQNVPSNNFNDFLNYQMITESSLIHLNECEIVSEEDLTQKNKDFQEDQRKSGFQEKKRFQEEKGFEIAQQKSYSSLSSVRPTQQIHFKQIHKTNAKFDVEGIQYQRKELKTKSHLIELVQREDISSRKKKIYSKVENISSYSHHSAATPPIFLIQQIQNPIQFSVQNKNQFEIKNQNSTQNEQLPNQATSSQTQASISNLFQRRTSKQNTRCGPAPGASRCNTTDLFQVEDDQNQNQNQNQNQKQNVQPGNGKLKKQQISQSLIAQIINDKGSELPPVSANSWIVLDGITGSQIFGKRVNQQVEVASLTKMMTLLVVLKQVKKFGLDIEQTYLKTSNICAHFIGTTACLKHKDEIKIIDLLYGLMLPSGNDAAGVLAEGIATLMYLEENGEPLNKIRELKLIGLRQKRVGTKGENLFGYQSNNLIVTGSSNSGAQQNCWNFNQSQINTWNGNTKDQAEYLTHEEKIKIFIKEMNRHSAEIGLSRSNFASVHGLINKSNISTAKDMAILGMTLMQDPLAQKIVATKQYTACIVQADKSMRMQMWENTNKLIDKTGYDGIKTGITDNAGACLATSYKKIINNIPYHLIIIVLNCRNMEARFQDTKAICRWTINKYIKKNTENNR